MLITTSRRLLDYCHIRDQLHVSVSKQNDRLCFDLTLPSSLNPSEVLQGITLYTDRPHATEVRLNGTVVTGIVHNAVDETGRPSVSVRWSKLDFPHL